MMAFNLKVKWLVFIHLILMTAFYLKRKTDQLGEQCRSAVSWWSALDRIKAWLTSLWTSTVHGEHHTALVQSSLSNGQTVPPCHASSLELLVHFLTVIIWEDVWIVGRSLLDGLCSSWTWLGDGVGACVCAGKEVFIKVFHNFLHCFQYIRGFAQAGVDYLSTGISGSYTLITLPQNISGLDFVSVLIFILVTVLLICALYSMTSWSKQYLHKRFRKRSESESAVQRRRALTVAHEQTDVDVDKDGHRHPLVIPVWWLLYVMLVLLCASIPWEFCRLYQVAVARKAAAAAIGLPAECSTEQLTWFQTMKGWLSWQLSWSHGDHCDRYYKAMFVDPLWEVTPFMVVTSLVTRCLVHPAEELAAGMGRSMRRFFSEIPSHWQPVCLLVIVTFTLTLVLTSCRYRLSVPLLLRVEPRTPVGERGGGGRERKEERVVAVAVRGRRGR